MRGVRNKRRAARWGAPLSHPRALLLSALLLAGGSRWALADHLLTLRIEGPGGVPTEARLSVIGADSQSYRPLPDSISLFFEPLGGYFYADSSAAMHVPAGPTRIRASKGLEFRSIDTTVAVVSDTVIVAAMERWIEPRSQGLVGGDVHAHLLHDPVVYHPDEAAAARVVRAEGLRVAHFLDNGYLFTGQVSAHCDTTATFFCSEEYRSPIFGHLSLLGIDSLLLPFGGSLGWPLNAEVVERARGHAHSLATYAH
ncbi:MAG: hypothetical protein ABIH26_02415, partial [Candidatus Eisenbacteria bacterium]